MPDQTRIVGPGPSDRTVRTTDGQILHAPADWELLSPGDATLTRRVKAAGPTWTIQVKKGRRTFSRGVWAPTDRIAMIRADLEAERSTDTLGNKDEVGGYELSGKVQIHWLPDGDHSFKPRKASGRTLEENWRGELRRLRISFVCFPIAEYHAVEYLTQDAGLPTSTSHTQRLLS